MENILTCKYLDVSSLARFETTTRNIKIPMLKVCHCAARFQRSVCNAWQFASFLDYFRGAQWQLTGAAARFRGYLHDFTGRFRGVPLVLFVVFLCPTGIDSTQ